MSPVFRTVACAIALMGLAGCAKDEDKATAAVPATADAAAAATADAASASAAPAAADAASMTTNGPDAATGEPVDANARPSAPVPAADPAVSAPPPTPRKPRPTK